jgi:MFS family permease
MSLGVVGSLGLTVVPPALPDLQEALAVSEGAIGWAQGAVALAGIFVSIYAGYLADRYGRRGVALAALVVFGVFGGACLFARSLWVLVLLRALQGVGMTCLLGFGIILIGDLFDGRERTRALGLNLAATMTSGVIAPMLSGLLAAGGHAFRPFYLFLLGLPVAVWATRLPADPPRSAHPPLRHFRATMALLREQGQTLDFLGVLIAGMVAVATAVGVGQTVVPLLLDGEFDVPAEWRGVILATFQAGAALMAFRVGRIRSRFGGPNAATGGMLLIGAGLVLSATAPDPWVVVAGLLVSGWGFGIFIPVAQGFITTASSGVYRGIAVGFWLTVVRVAQSAGPPSGTAVSDAAGERWALGLAAAAVITTALLWRPLRRLLSRSTGTAEGAPDVSDG